jgi:hypothetical protein
MKTKKETKTSQKKKQKSIIFRHCVVWYGKEDGRG